MCSGTIGEHISRGTRRFQYFYTHQHRIARSSLVSIIVRRSPSCEPDHPFTFALTFANMYTSFIATIALAASVLAAPAPIEKRQGAVTCGSTVRLPFSALSQAQA